MAVICATPALRTNGHSGRANHLNEFRAHGKDERVPVKSFHEDEEYLHRLVKMLSDGTS